MTGKTKTVFTLLAPSMVTLGMMCHVLTVTTTRVLKVLSVTLWRFITIYLNLHVPDSESIELKLHLIRSEHNYSMLGRWLDRLHENEERVTPISLIIRNIWKQVVYICIKKCQLALKWPQKPEIGVIKRKTTKAFIRWKQGKSRAKLRLLFNPVF